MGLSVVLFALGVLAILIWLFLRGRGERMPGEIVYRDTPDVPTLYSQKYRLAGRPDYIVRESDGFVPVEVKSRQCGKFGPYPGERAQLLAYCLLTEEEFGGRVVRGELQYPNRNVLVLFGEQEREEIASLLHNMRAARDLHRSHQQEGRCRSCGFRARCDEALA
jgi:CRISPR/Cas system-associated exonuclease Cas4 (RecB family)